MGQGPASVRAIPWGVASTPADLRRYSFHTGAPLRPLEADEPCPVLFRDVGVDGMELYLSGRLARLAGPLSPLVYMRTHQYVEPYVDYESIGRLAIVRPLSLAPWHSGVPFVYVAHSTCTVHSDTIGFVPGSVTLPRAVELLSHVRCEGELREALGGTIYDEARKSTLANVRDLQRACAEAEKMVRPLRRSLQSSDAATHDWARAEMQKHGISKSDLCCAWHHVPRPRRTQLIEAVLEIYGGQRYLRYSA